MSSEQSEIEEGASAPFSVVEPDGYFIAHHRMSDTQYFGPFKTVAEANAWCSQHPDVRGIILPMWLSVDWNRR